TVLVAANDALITKREAIARLVAAHVDEVAWIQDHPAEARAMIGEQLTALQGKALPPSLIARAMANVEVTWNPMESVLQRLAADARALGSLPAGDLSRMVDRTFLDQALALRQRP